ncbi:CidA/LrgA family protein [Sporomusa acidovorans]|nr:CidA/LrgA family protein [Sporomusa acidovorans]
MRKLDTVSPVFLTKAKTLLKIVVQVSFLGVIAWLSNLLARHMAWGIPGSILGIAFLFIALQLRILPLSWVEAGASLLIAELVLFFIPSAVAVMQFEPLLKQNGLSFFVVITIGTLGVMLVVGIITETLMRYQERR